MSLGSVAGFSLFVGEEGEMAGLSGSIAGSGAPGGVGKQGLELRFNTVMCTSRYYILEVWGCSGDIGIKRY